MNIVDTLSPDDQMAAHEAMIRANEEASRREYMERMMAQQQQNVASQPPP